MSGRFAYFRQDEGQGAAIRIQVRFGGKGGGNARDAYLNGMRVLSAALFLCVSVAPALAESGWEVETLEACFDGAPEEDRRARKACIGQVYAACQERDGDESTVGIAACLQGEWMAWDAMVAREYAALHAMAVEMDAASPENFRKEAGALEAAQDAWHAYVVAQCGGYAHAKWHEGSMRQIDAALCYRDNAASRAIFLWQERQPLPWPEDVRWAE